jgi:WhiB family redox-sensing transcriptional regulator
MKHNGPTTTPPVLRIATALTRDGDDLDWHARAACAGTPERPPVLGWDGWFPAHLSTAQQHRAESAARDICWRECPVRTDCLEAALVNGETSGIWGGYTPAERHRLT